MPAASTTQITDLATTLRLACMRISRRVRFESTEAIAPHHFSVLMHLSKGERMPGELAALEKVSAPSMTRTIGGLVDLGYAARSVDADDKRCVRVAITDAGRAVLKDTLRSRNAWMATRVAGLTPREREVLAEASIILERLAAE
ncbi:MarR family winged helix-turn-helix transcriptional regulator [Nostocoides australiense]|nr:MarR family transcriptional regulator [Tetrasphaera australiensis]